MDTAEDTAAAMAAATMRDHSSSRGRCSEAAASVDGEADGAEDIIAVDTDTEEAVGVADTDGEADTTTEGVRHGKQQLSRTRYRPFSRPALRFHRSHAPLSAVDWNRTNLLQA